MKEAGALCGNGESRIIFDRKRLHLRCAKRTADRPASTWASGKKRTRIRRWWATSLSSRTMQTLFPVLLWFSCSGWCLRWVHYTCWVGFPCGSWGMLGGRAISGRDAEHSPSPLLETDMAVCLFLSPTTSSCDPKFFCALASLVSFL